MSEEMVGGGDVAGRTSRAFTFLGLGILAVVLLSLVTLLGGEEGQRFLSVGAQFIPFAVLAALAYGGAKNSASALFAYLWLAVLGIGMLFLSLGLTLLAYVKDWNLLVQVSRDPNLFRTLNINEVFKSGVYSALLWTMLLLTLTAILAGAMLLRPVRVCISRIMPIDPDNFTHKIALPMLTLIFMSMVIPLIVLGGRPPILELLGNPTLQDASNGSGAGGVGGADIRLQDLFYQFVWTIPATLVAGGWPIARNFLATLKRLGMVRPSLMQVGVGIALGVGMAFVATFGLDPAIRWLWQSLGWPVTDTAAFGDLLSGVVNPLGAALIGITAGVGEEMAFRGLLQPRIGLLAANLLFTATHALQYGWEALLSVFLIGLVLGVVRARSNTSTAAIVHGVYDFTLVMGAVLFGS